MLTSKTYSVGARVVCPVQMRVESRLVTLALHSLLGLMNVIVSMSGCLQFAQLHSVLVRCSTLRSPHSTTEIFFFDI